MLTAEWHRLFKTNQTVFWEKRAEFLSDPDNAFNCENCPDPTKELAGKYPCGDSCLIYDHARIKAKPGEVKMKNKNERPQRPENVIVLDKDGRIVDPPWVKVYEMRIKSDKNKILRLWIIAFIMMTICVALWCANTIIAKSERNAALDRVETLQEENTELMEQNKALQESIDKLKKEAAEKTAKAEVVTTEAESAEVKDTETAD